MRSTAPFLLVSVVVMMCGKLIFSDSSSLYRWLRVDGGKCKMSGIAPSYKNTVT